MLVGHGQASSFGQKFAQLAHLRRRDRRAAVLPRDAYVRHDREGTYWGIRTNIADYGLPDAMNCPFDETMKLANVATRLKALDATVQERIINWGYAVCDAALRKHVDQTLPPPVTFPYPASGV